MTDNQDSAAGAVVDLAVLDDLRRLQEPNEPLVLREMIDMFLRNTPPRLESLHTAQAAHDYTAVSRTVHGLKGSCGLFGAQRMIAVCEKLQEHAHTCDMQDAESGFDSSIAYQQLAEWIHALEIEFRLVQVELEKWR